MFFVVVVVLVVVVERVRNKSMKTNLGSSWDSNKDLLNISQTNLPLSHLDPWQEVENKLHKQQCQKAPPNPNGFLLPQIATSYY